jgi:alkylation response protein AidB-like acyl-CoA dehydrogenase
LAPTWPRQYGGMGLSAAKHMIYVEEWGRLGCPRIPDHGIGLVGPLLIQYGTEEQKAHYLPRILSGEHVWCQGYSEPNAGSDLASLRTSAELDGDVFVVTGQKIWTTLAHCANWIFVLVRTERDAKVRQKGITVLLLDLTSPGVRVRPIENLRGETDFCEVFFDNVRVPLKNLVGKINEGWTVAKSVLGHERIFLGAPTRPEYALERLRRLAESRGAFEDPAFLSRFARLRLDLYDLGSAFERYAKVLRAGGELGADVSALKIFTTELYQRITEEILMIAGEEARLADDLAAGDIEIDAMNLFLDSRSPAIFGGSNEIQRNILAKAVLQLPG